MLGFVTKALVKSPPKVTHECGSLFESLVYRADAVFVGQLWITFLIWMSGSLFFDECPNCTVSCLAREHGLCLETIYSEHVVVFTQKRTTCKRKAQGIKYVEHRNGF